MNNNVENDFFGFPKVKWLHLTGEVDKSVRCLCQIFSGFNIPKIIKRWTFFGTGYYCYCLVIFYYHAMLCIRGTSHGPVSVSVCLSLCVTSRCSTKTAKHRITQTKPHDSSGTLVFRCQRSPQNSTGVTPYWDAKCR